MESTYGECAEGVAFEGRLWAAADVLRGWLAPADTRHVVFALLFLKGAAALSGRMGASAALRAPTDCTWDDICQRCIHEEPATVLDKALQAWVEHNPVLVGAVEPVFVRLGGDAGRLRRVLGVFSGISIGGSGATGRDTLGRVYEFFLSRFAATEGRGGGEFYTPSCIVRLMVQLVRPTSGAVYDPCCGSGGMFVQAMDHVERSGEGDKALVMVGQESNPSTWRMARTNLALRGIPHRLGARPADTFHDEQHRDFKADFVLANPPFNGSRWGAQECQDDPRWAWGLPPDSNANFAWLQHILHHLKADGTAAVVLANGSLVSTQGGEGELRRRLVEADVVDCVVALPSQLFYTTQIPACIWILTHNKTSRNGRARNGTVLLLDARKLGTMVSRVQRVLEDGDIERISKAYGAFRWGEGPLPAESGFSRVVPTEEVSAQGFRLSPGRYVGVAPHAVEASEASVDALIDTLRGLQVEAARLDVQIADMLDGWSE